MTIRRILVANRGEIACRIIRGAHALGREAVAVYSEADADAPHVRLADAAVGIGPATAAESYLNAEAILRAAREAGADAVHPGYGFLAENPEFARRCAEAGLVFIGPPAEAIALMGDKAAARRRMLEAGVPCVPGYEGEDQSDEAFAVAARKIGYPVMVKAAAGGGGRGMRLVTDESGLTDSLARARAESLGAFGSDRLILERAIERPRHVEFQVFADTRDALIHLGERDCSVQRRHQKVVEEAPCPVMTAELRTAMGAAAVEAARSIGYVGAGTVEFLLDPAGAFYFLEMNTRLQVEHPVTEMVTGIDLVALQIRVADGEALGIAQDEVRLSGHAIEARLYAEDARREFLPSTGRIALWRPPAGPGIRVDDAVVTGSDITPYYDPLVAKIIAHGESREAARLALVAALEETALFGVENNRDFLIEVLKRERFAAGEATTAFIEDETAAGRKLCPDIGPRDAAVAAVLQYRLATEAALDASVGVAPALRDWASAGRLASRYRYELGGSILDLTVSPDGRGHYEVAAADEAWRIAVSASCDRRARVVIDGRAADVLFCATDADTLHLSLDGRSATFENLAGRFGAADEGVGGGRVVAAMHGLLVELAVAPGERVERGRRLLVLEAMKMQHEIRAEAPGIVSAVHAGAGEQIAAGQLILEIEIEEATAA